MNNRISGENLARYTSNLKQYISDLHVSPNFGESNIATGTYSLVAGKNNTNSGNYSTVLGNQNKNYNHYATVVGKSNKNGTTGSFIAGGGLDNGEFTKQSDGSYKLKEGGVGVSYSSVFGFYNTFVKNAIFTIGNGTKDSNRRNSLVITQYTNASSPGSIVLNEPTTINSDLSVTGDLEVGTLAIFNDTVDMYDSLNAYGQVQVSNKLLVNATTVEQGKETSVRIVGKVNVTSTPPDTTSALRVEKGDAEHAIYAVGPITSSTSMNCYGTFKVGADSNSSVQTTIDTTSGINTKKNLHVSGNGQVNGTFRVGTSGSAITKMYMSGGILYIQG